MPSADATYLFETEQDTRQQRKIAERWLCSLADRFGVLDTR